MDGNQGNNKDYPLVMNAVLRIKIKYTSASDWVVRKGLSEEVPS